jgi:hypothetical protein
MTSMLESLKAGDTLYPITNTHLNNSANVHFGGFELPDNLPAFVVATTADFTCVHTVCSCLLLVLTDRAELLPPYLHVCTSSEACLRTSVQDVGLLRRSDVIRQRLHSRSVAL